MRQTFFDPATGKDFYLFYKGRVALYAILEAMGVGSGDEVVMPAYTCVVVPNAVIYRGATPVYVDIELSSFSVRPETVAKALGSATKVLLCQNTYGLSAHVDELVDLCRSRGIYTIEDCTHGYGGTYKGKPNGSWCDAAFYSSQWNKPFSTGVGGYALVENPKLSAKIEARLAELPPPSIKTQAMLWMLLKVRHLVNPSTYYALVSAYRYLSKRNLVTGSSTGDELTGTKMPEDYLLGMSGVQMKAIDKALKKLPALKALRKANGAYYTAKLAAHGLNHVAPALHDDHLFLKYPLLVHDRVEFVARAQVAKIPLGDWFCSPLHPVEGNLRQWSFDFDQYPNAVFAASHVVNLPTDTRNPEAVMDFVEKNTALVMDTTLDGRMR